MAREFQIPRQPSESKNSQRGCTYVAVGEAVIDGRQPRGVRVADPRELDGGRLAGEDVEAVVGGVAREVHQDVHPLLWSDANHNARKKTRFLKGPWA